MTKKNLAVIGNGMAAERFLEEMVRKHGLTRYTISVFGEEAGGSYNRLLLGKVLGGESPDSIVTKPVEWYARHGVALHSGISVKRLDTDAGDVETTNGQRHRYDLAVIATGSQPLVPPIEGVTAKSGDLRPGIFLYRSMADCLGMRSHARAGDNAVVLGGGLLGLEAAKELSDLGLHVTVVHARRLLMNAQLDDLGGAMLQRHVEKRGIFVRTGHTIEAVLGDGPITALRLDDGKKIAADLLVLACGVRPRVEVAKASGLPINKGILVNDALATEVPGIYAIGDCAEHNGKTYGLAAPAWKDVLAKSGVEPARARTLLEMLLREKRLLRIADDLVFHRSAIDGLRQMLAARKAQRFNVAAFKEWTGISRKYAIPLLEHLDRERITRREGDQRVVL